VKSDPIHCNKRHTGVASTAGRHCVATDRAVVEGRRDAQGSTSGSPGGG
jgi:hypothetical protein